STGRAAGRSSEETTPEPRESTRRRTAVRPGSSIGMAVNLAWSECELSPGPEGDPVVTIRLRLLQARWRSYCQEANCEEASHAVAGSSRWRRLRLSWPTPH